jgi:hypothetical protein
MTFAGEIFNSCRRAAGPVRILAGCVVLMALFVLLDLLHLADDESLKREGGGLETVTLVFYVLAAGAFFAIVPRSRWSSLAYLPALIVLFALREMDADKAFTDAGVLSLRLYSGQSALYTKVIAGSVALFAVAVVLYTLWRGVPAMLREGHAGATWPRFAAASGLLLLGSKAIDGLERKVVELGVKVTFDLDLYATLVEETAEAFIPVFMILAMRARWPGVAS